MPDLLVDYSHKCPVALATILAMQHEAGAEVKLLLAMPSDEAATDGSALLEAIRQSRAEEVPAHLTEWLVMTGPTLTLSHDVGVGHFRANDDIKLLFSLKYFLDMAGFSYVITHVDTGLTISDLSGLTELRSAA